VTLVIATMALIAILPACGGGGRPVPTPTPELTPVLPPVVPTPGPEGRVVYQETPYVIARIVERPRFDRSLLEPAGEVVAIGGVSAPAFVCPGGRPQGCEASEWEVVTEGAAAWYVWEPAAVSAARKDLALALGLREAAVTAVQAAAVDWPDACLGLAQPGEACAEVITPGFLVRLEAQGVSYEYHTSLSGDLLRRAGAPGGAQPTLVTGGPKPSRDTAARAAVAHLARRLGVPGQDISITQVEERQWPDACLGLPEPGELCAQVITPGFAVTLRHAGTTYLYRTNADGSVLRFEE
jgi:hypothetical protein